MKYYLLTFKENHGDEFDVPALACMKQKEFDTWKKTPLAIHGYLGNYADGFAEDLQGMTGEQLIKHETVTVMEVTKDFHDIFHKAQLYYLSICNVFDGEVYDGS